MSFRSPFTAVALFCALAAGAVVSAPANTAHPPEVLYFPTPQAAVDVMLEMADLKEGDVLIDLGSGDGRIPITAAKRYGIRAEGVDINPDLVAKATENAEQAGVADKVVFKEQDLFETELGDATVITLFLLTSINLKLRPELLKLAPGTRILSYNFGMGEWTPDRTEIVEGRAVHLWVVPDKAPEFKPIGP
ncbi:SAM-dependent methyltransferase [Hyphomicrobium nitrativorans]|uniref:SAM-dependent methyltransferase n=1 Tax=Hyphomicrobium nitrativorans TaxID=1427356 RepID=UPI00059D244B|nr:methyltransferase domain-containing protein [Hyphomicrobium nitrativorans]